MNIYYELKQRQQKAFNDFTDGNVFYAFSRKQFEEGMKLSQKCNKILEEAEKKITILVNGEEKDFDVNKAE